jgi:hypothetical protein
MATNPIERENAPEISEALKKKFDCIGPNVSPEHRAILEAALADTSSPSFNELLASMPNVGLDSDFAPSRE